MDPAILQDTIRLIPDPEELAKDFYDRLFAAGDDAVLDMFPVGRMARQRSRLVQALVHITATAGDLDTLAAYLTELGAHHRIFDGITPAHFGLVGDKLLAALRKALGGDEDDGGAWTRARADTWTQAYSLIAQVMVKGLTGPTELPPWWTARVTGAERRGLDITILTCKVDGPAGSPPLAWAAGQSLGVQIDAWPPAGPSRRPPRAWRFYSPAHPPGPAGAVELHVRREPRGALSTALGRSLPGTRLRFTPPVGALRWDPAAEPDPVPKVLAGGATGLAPLLAIVLGHAQLAAPPDLGLYFGARWPADLYYADDLAKLASQHQWLTVTCAVSGPAGETAGWDGPRGLVGQVAADRPGGWAGHAGYVCGGQAMTEHAVKALTDAGASPVVYENFGQGA